MGAQVRALEAQLGQAEQLRAEHLQQQPTPDVQAQVAELESEVARLEALVNDRAAALAAAEERARRADDLETQVEQLEAQVAQQQTVPAAENDGADALASELQEVLQVNASLKNKVKVLMRELSDMQSQRGADEESRAAQQKERDMLQAQNETLSEEIEVLEKEIAEVGGHGIQVVVVVVA